MNKGREFWLLTDADGSKNADYLSHEPTRHTISDFIHVIEYRAHKTALQTLKEISLSTEFIHGYGEVPTEPAKKALKALKELGEHE